MWLAIHNYFGGFGIFIISYESCILFDHFLLIFFWMNGIDFWSCLGYDMFQFFNIYIVYPSVKSDMEPKFEKKIENLFIFSLFSLFSRPKQSIGIRIDCVNRMKRCFLQSGKRDY